MQGKLLHPCTTSLANGFIFNVLSLIYQKFQLENLEVSLPLSLPGEWQHLQCHQHSFLFLFYHLQMIALGQC